jgi:hypothetical protein
VSCATQCECTQADSCRQSACYGGCVDTAVIERAACSTECRRNPVTRAAIRSCNNALRACSKTCRSE